MGKFVCVIWLVFAAVVTSAEPPSQSKAKAALALAKAARERERIVFDSSKCYDDFAEAETVAKATGRRLVLWVGGLTCKDLPDLRKRLADCVHCHVQSHEGSAVPRVVILSPGESK